MNIDLKVLEDSPNFENPKHYQGKNMNGRDVLKSFLSDEQLKGFYKGNILKYVLRYEKKNGLDDLRKTEQYLKWLIELEESLSEEEQC